MIHRLILCTLFLIGGGVFAQDITEPTARGVISIPTSSIGTEAILLNPLYCQTEICTLMSPLMFPSLVNIDPMGGSLQLADDDNYALIEHWALSSDDDSYIYMLRNDAMWSDGTLITAYDVFFSYLAITSRETTSNYRSDLDRYVQAMIPINESTLVVIPHDLDCDILQYTNFPIIPVHVFDKEFATRAMSMFDADNATLEILDNWLETDTVSYRDILGHSFSFEPTVNYGDYRFESQSAQDNIRLAHINGQQVIETARSSRGQSGIDDVIAGDIAYYVDPPRNQWNDLRNNAHVNTVTNPSHTWYFVAFNFTDLLEPLSYRDAEGDIQEQDPHPIFINHDVRQAIQLGIDVQELIDVALWGEGDIMSGYSLPSSWAHNLDLDPIGYDPDFASQLLEEAGWRRTNPRGTRICIGCGTTDDDRRLAFRLVYDNNREIDRIVASLIAKQLARIGVEVDLSGSSNALNTAQSQNFNLYLGSWDMSFPVRPDKSWFFSPENDIIGSGYNIGSYNNPEITAQYEIARTLDGCDRDNRRMIYYELERQVQDDQPYVWLFTPYEMTVFHNSIQSVKSIPNRHLANIYEWSVWKMR